MLGCVGGCWGCVGGMGGREERGKCVGVCFGVFGCVLD